MNNILLIANYLHSICKTTTPDIRIIHNGNTFLFIFYWNDLNIFLFIS